MEVVAMKTLMQVCRATVASIFFTVMFWGLLSLAGAEPEKISPPANRVPAVWLSPRILDPAEAGIGKLVPDLELQSIEGQSHRLHGPAGRRGTVIVVRDPGCPVSRRYGPRISKLARQFSADGYGFVFIYPNEELQNEQRTQDAEHLDAPGLYVDRGSFALGDALGVNSTGDVFILDADHRLRYRGAVDDQYGLGYTRDFPTQHYLRNALESLRQGREVETPATAAPGCYIDADPAKDRLLPQLPGGQMFS
jgi:hypothetical protein